MLCWQERAKDKSYTLKINIQRIQFSMVLAIFFFFLINERSCIIQPYVRRFTYSYFNVRNIQNIFDDIHIPNLTIYF